MPERLGGLYKAGIHPPYRAHRFFVPRTTVLHKNTQDGSPVSGEPSRHCRRKPPYHVHSECLAAPLLILCLRRLFRILLSAIFRLLSDMLLQEQPQRTGDEDGGIETTEKTCDQRQRKLFQ